MVELHYIACHTRWGQLTIRRRVHGYMWYPPDDGGEDEIADGRPMKEARPYAGGTDLRFGGAIEVEARHSLDRGRTVGTTRSWSKAG